MFPWLAQEINIERLGSAFAYRDQSVWDRMTSVFGGKKAGMVIYRALGIKASQMWNGLTCAYSFNVANTRQMSDCKRILFQVNRFCNRI